jgi:hypothetical protein
MEGREMTEKNPLFSATWHAARAEDLTRLALSASMSGWWKRGRRRELLAAAQVHATLGAVAMPVDRPSTMHLRYDFATEPDRAQP